MHAKGNIICKSTVEKLHTQHAKHLTCIQSASFAARALSLGMNSPKNENV